MTRTSATFAALAALALAAAPHPAQAQQTTSAQSKNINTIDSESGTTSGTNSGTVTFTQFNPALGVLTGINLNYGAMDRDVLYLPVAEKSNPGTFTATDQSRVTFTTTGSTVTTTNTSSQVVKSFGSPDAGPYGGTSPVYEYFVPFSLSLSTTLTDVVDVAAFTGVGTVNVSYSSLGQIATSLNDSQVQESDTGDFAPVYLSYTYLPLAPAPEPSQFVALLVGALGLGALTLRAKRRRAA